MTTYNQEKLGLSAYYDKRRVLADGIHTEPIEYVEQEHDPVVALCHVVRSAALPERIHEWDHR